MSLDFRQRARELLERFVVHEAQHVIVAPIATGELAEHDECGSECVVVESVTELDAIAPEIPPAFHPEKLRERVAEGCFLLLVRRPVVAGAEGDIVGYRLGEPAIFSSLGLRAVVSSDIAFIHNTEVLPAYRGQRIALALRECSHRYCRQRQVRWTCGVVSNFNTASIAAHLRVNSGTTPRIVATVHKFSFLGGRLVWRTPWRQIRNALGEGP